MIDADALLEKKFDICADGKCAEVIYAADVMYAPAVDAERHGEWIDYQSKDPSMCRTDGKSVFIQCSECFDIRVRNFAAALNYCPYCGAKMDGDEYKKSGESEEV